MVKSRAKKPHKSDHKICHIWRMDCHTIFNHGWTVNQKDCSAPNI